MKNKYLFSIIAALLCNFMQAQFTWKDTGPILFPTNISGQIDGIGRATQIKFSPIHTNRMYACTASGGLWISNNSGATWHVTGTDTLPALNTSAICIDYTNDNILYLSSGDPNYYGEGFGIWKSTDGGASWALANTGIGTRMALELIMSPSNHNVLVAATDDGIWKTTDAGAAWTETKTGGQFTDMKQKAAPNSTTLFACTMDELWKSVDFGDSWQQVTNNIVMPVDSNYSGCRLAVSVADSNRVYFMSDKDHGTVWRSTDGGNSFNLVYHNPAVSLTGYDSTTGGQGNYDFALIAHPDSPNVVYTSSHCVWRSDDGGVTWNQKTNWYAILHTDMHYFCFDPLNHNKLFNANDGGVWYTTGDGTNWNESSDSLANTEVYHSGQSKLLPNVVSIGTQDNGELMYNTSTWYCNRGGDWGPYSDFDNTRPGTVYYITNGNRRDIVGNGSDQSLNLPFIADGTTRMAFSEFNGNLGFASEQDVYRTRNLQSDTPVWLKLTNITRDILALATSAADSNRLYFITNNGRFYRSLNATATTPTFTSSVLPFTPQVVSSIAPVKTNVAIVYLAIDNKVYRSANSGANWTDITYNLPGLNAVGIIHDEHSTDESVYMAVGSSVYYKNVGMNTWQNISSTLPSVANIQDFNIFNDGTACSKLRVAYYGRGVWETPLSSNTKPLVNVGSNDTIICPNNSVQFSFGVCGNIDSISWQFAGGSPAVSTAYNPTILYSSAGVYPATLIAKNIFGSDTATINITVTGSYPLPLVQGFELPLYPPVNWKLVDSGGSNIFWKRVTTTGGYGNSAASILFDNYNYSTSGERDQIWTQRVDLDSLLSVQLTFDVAYAPWGGGCGYPDSLNVLISTDCGETQTVLYSKSCDSLATAANIQDSLFVPRPNQWRTDAINLNNYIGDRDVVIIFENIGHYGQGIYLDNININGVTPQSPVVAFSANKQTVCAGDSVQFTDESTNNPIAWNWTFGNGTPATSPIANPVVVYDTAGIYPVTLNVTNAYGSNTQTVNSYITVNALPQQPFIIKNANVLLALSFSTGNYQWYFNGSLISGATATAYIPTAQGVYTVVLTDSNGCSSSSASFLFTFTDVTVVDGNFITVSPNPNNGKFSLRFNADDNYNLSIQNSLGQQILTYKIEEAPGILTRDIDISQFEAGVYLVSLSNATKKYLKKVVVGF